MHMIFVGPHVSIAGSVSLAPDRAKAVGATGFAIFTKNQRVWKAPALKEEDAAAFRERLAADGFVPAAVLPHAGYLINPATPDEALWEKSLGLFIDEARRTAMLGLQMINIHPGAYKEGAREDGIARAATMVDRVLDEVPSISVAIENTAGAGTILGSSFEELDALLSASKHQERVGFTLDTAHLCGAGYDVAANPAGILDSFVSRFGRRKLLGMHLNDSMVPLGSRKDRHAPLGKGCIGREAFRAIVCHPAADSIPLILETPDESAWPEEAAYLLSAR